MKDCLFLYLHNLSQCAFKSVTVVTISETMLTTRGARMVRHSWMAAHYQFRNIIKDCLYLYLLI